MFKNWNEELCSMQANGVCPQRFQRFCNSDEHCRSCYPLNVRGTRSSSIIWRLHPEQYHAEARSGRCGGCAVIQQIANLVVYMMIMHQVENNTLIITFKVKNWKCANGRLILGECDGRQDYDEQQFSVTELLGILRRLSCYSSWCIESFWQLFLVFGLRLWDVNMLNWITWFLIHALQKAMHESSRGCVLVATLFRFIELLSIFNVVIQNL